MTKGKLKRDILYLADNAFVGFRLFLKAKTELSVYFLNVLEKSLRKPRSGSSLWSMLSNQIYKRTQFSRVGVKQ